MTRGAQRSAAEHQWSQSCRVIQSPIPLLGASFAAMMGIAKLAEFAWGSGDGPITDDGCAVELYRLLSADREVAMISSVVWPEATVLDLGAGAGRLAQPLASRGYKVVAVDQSAEMLAEIHDVERIKSKIETLELGNRVFDCVLLASYLLNTPDRVARADFLRCCRRHLAAGGLVLIQVRNAGLLDDMSGFERDEDGIIDIVEFYQRVGFLVTMKWRTEFKGRKWAQTFTHEFLDDIRLTNELSEQHLRFDRWLDKSREWFAAKAL